MLLVPSSGVWEASPEHCRACHCWRLMASLTCMHVWALSLVLCA